MPTNALVMSINVPPPPPPPPLLPLYSFVMPYFFPPFSI